MAGPKEIKKDVYNWCIWTIGGNLKPLKFYWYLIDWLWRVLRYIISKSYRTPGGFPLLNYNLVNTVLLPQKEAPENNSNVGGGYDLQKRHVEGMHSPGRNNK